MEWVKFSEVKDKIAVGEILLATVLLDAGTRVLFTAIVDTDNELRNVQRNNKIGPVEPDYVAFITYPDNHLFSHFI